MIFTNAPRVNKKASISLHFLDQPATHPLIAGIWLVCGLLLGLVILPLRQQECNADCLAATIYTSLIPAIWLAVRHLLSKNSAKKIKEIEIQINSANQA